VNWDEILPNNYDPNSIFDHFYSKLDDIINKHAPMRVLSRKEIKFYTKPWITSGIKKSIKEKDKLFKKYIKSKSLYNHSKYKLYRNTLVKVIKCKQKNVLQQLF
jgi:hypothetical protein